MRKNAADIKINVWINEERLDALEEAGMAHMAKEEFAGMKLLAVTMTEEQKDIVLHRFPSAKFDSSTTRSIELLPKQERTNCWTCPLKCIRQGRT